MLNFFKKLLILTILCFSSICYAEITDQQLKQYASKMDKIMPDIMKKLGVPGAAYCISRKDKIMHMATFGSTVVGSNPDIENDTVFPLASFSKNVAGILVGVLVDQKKINLDDKVRKYLPELFLENEELSNEITIRDLVSFRSGFHHFSADDLFAAGYAKEKILSAFKHIKQIPGEFRKKYAYQNIIFGIVGDVIERATGEKYEDLVQRHIFDKLKMETASAIPLKYEQNFFGYLKYRASRFGHDSNRLGFFAAAAEFFKTLFKHKNKKVVTPHMRYEDKLDPSPHTDILHLFPASTGISFSANDLAKWTAMLAGKGTYRDVQIVSPEMFEELSSKMVAIDNIKENDKVFPKERISRKDLAYGIGVFEGTYMDNGANEHPILFHNAGMYGSTSFFAVSLNDDISIGVASNLGGTANTLFCQYSAFQFLDLCFGFSQIDWAKYELDNYQEIKNKLSESHNNLKEKNLGAMDIPENYIGTYTSDIYGDVEITLENNELFLSNGIKKTKLNHVNRDIFEFPCNAMLISYFNKKEYIVFHRENEGKFNSVFITAFDAEDTKFSRKN